MSRVTTSTLTPSGHGGHSLMSAFIVTFAAPPAAPPGQPVHAAPPVTPAVAAVALASLPAAFDADSNLARARFDRSGRRQGCCDSTAIGASGASRPGTGRSAGAAGR